MAHRSDENGFTLIEILISLAIGIIVITAVLMSYEAQVKSSLTHEQMVSLNQKARAALFLMSRDIRTAGYDPDPTHSANTSILNATNTLLRFSSVVDGTASTVQVTEYRLQDNNGDGVTDVTRQIDSGPVATVASGVDQLEFFYTLDDGTTATNPLNPSSVRVVQTSLLVRADSIDRDYTDTLTYQPPRPAGDTPPSWGPYNDHFRRRLLTNTIYCRNQW